MSPRTILRFGPAVILLWASPALAQVPGLPGGIGGMPPMGGASPLGGMAPGAAALPGAASSARGLTGICGNLEACVQKCLAKLCASQFGMMLGSLATGPVASVTGGFLPSLCPPMNAAQAAAMAAAQPGSAAAAAAAIQASEADAKARVAAIEYLGTVDCSRWPEAKAALINGLRQDPNECVRFAAARALNSGCCCDKKTIEALRLCVSGETTDGAPAENSPRVKAAAFSALQNCLMRVPEDLPPETRPPLPEGAVPNLVPLPPLPETPARIPAAGPHLAASYRPMPPRPVNSYRGKLSRKTFAQTVNEARRTVLEVAREPHPSGVIPTGQRSVFGAFSRARREMAAAQSQRGPEALRPGQPDPDVRPASAPGAPARTSPSRPVPGLGPWDTPAAPKTGTSRAGSAEGPAANANLKAMPAQTAGTSAHRGLIGMLFSPQR